MPYISNFTNYAAYSLSQTYSDNDFLPLSFPTLKKKKKRNNLIISECLNSLIDLILCIWATLLNARGRNTQADCYWQKIPVQLFRWIDRMSLRQVWIILNLWLTKLLPIEMQLKTTLYWFPSWWMEKNGRKANLSLSLARSHSLSSRSTLNPLKLSSSIALENNEWRNAAMLW